jgi:hypothetical protein
MNRPLRASDLPREAENGISAASSRESPKSINCSTPAEMVKDERASSFAQAVHANARWKTRARLGGCLQVTMDLLGKGE